MWMTFYQTLSFCLDVNQPQTLKLNPKSLVKDAVDFNQLIIGHNKPNQVVEAVNLMVGYKIFVMFLSNVFEHSMINFGVFQQ